jgi:hypothetical protein
MALQDEYFLNIFRDFICRFQVIYFHIGVSGNRPVQSASLASNVPAFVLLGASSIHRSRERLKNVVVKDKNLFYCSLELHELIKLFFYDVLFNRQNLPMLARITLCRSGIIARITGVKQSFYNSFEIGHLWFKILSK